MRENINKVSQRGERLDSLQDKTDNLAVSAQGFRRGANRVRKQMWWKDMKMRVCLVIVVIILIIVIVVPAGELPSACEISRTPLTYHNHSCRNQTLSPYLHECSDDVLSRVLHPSLDFFFFNEHCLFSLSWCQKKKYRVI